MPPPIRFVGMFAAFPVGADDRKVGFLRGLLGLEEEPPFRRMEVGRLGGKIRWLPFNREKFRRALDHLDAGEFNYLTLTSLRTVTAPTEEWAGTYDRPESLEVHWVSSAAEVVGREKSPIEERYGRTGFVVVHYPLPRFEIGAESPFQRKLLEYVKRAFGGFQLHWAFVHQGRMRYPVDMLGSDRIFEDSRAGFPLVAFATDFHSMSTFAKDHVRGAFWANFLNPLHVDGLGGKDVVRRERPCDIIEDLEGDRMLLQVDASPLAEVTPAATERYQRLRRFMAPILLETQADMVRLQSGILGSWRPPIGRIRNVKRYIQREIKKGERSDDWTL